MSVFLTLDEYKMPLRSYKNKRPHISMVAFEITPHCNLTCRYCYNPWSRPNQKPPFSPSYRASMQTLKKLFRRAHVGRISITGGEPFLAPRLPEVVLFCRMKKASVTLISNGSCGDREDYRRLVDLGVDLFEFPLHHAQAEIHDWMTQVPGSWRASLNSIGQVLDLGAQVVPVIVLTAANLAGLETTLHFLKGLGTRRIMLNRFNIGGRGIPEARRLTLSIGQLKDAYQTANRLGSELSLSISSNVCTPMCVLHPRDYPALKFGFCSNDLTRLPLTLNSKGDLRLCNHSPHVAGNLYSQSLTDIFNSEYAKRWISTCPGFCRDCPDYMVCRAGCRAAAEQLGANLDKADPLVDPWNGVFYV